MIRTSAGLAIRSPSARSTASPNAKFRHRAPSRLRPQLSSHPPNPVLVPDPRLRHRTRTQHQSQDPDPRTCPCSKIQFPLSKHPESRPQRLPRVRGCLSRRSACSRLRYTMNQVPVPDPSPCPRNCTVTRPSHQHRSHNRPLPRRPR